MKKVLLLTLVFVVVAAGAAFAGIAGSKHDLTSAGTGAVTSNIAEICVFCHTPHGSNTTMTAAPLWNRNSTSTTWTNYNSSTMNGTSNTNGAISQACLSCHDGSVGGETLVNGSGSGNLNADVSGNMNGDNFTTIANLNDTPSLQNDHPIGLNMTTINGQDSGIKASPSNANLRLFSGLVECATCHVVHNSTTDQPFLAMSNSGSGMCLACHNK